MAIVSCSVNAVTAGDLGRTSSMRPMLEVQWLVFFALFVPFGCARPAQKASRSTEPGRQKARLELRRPAPRVGIAGCKSAEPEPARGAVLELFTSEGCSSCPPADGVLAELVARSESSGGRLYALGFHVDYWDHLGWRDAFSNPAYSERQRWYAASAGGGVYTPELVVSGVESFVGSDGRRAIEAIERAERSPWSARIALTSHSDGRITYAVSGVARAAHLNLALIQPRAESKVSSGENSGKALSHVNVVRAFSRAALARSGRGSWSPPSSPVGAASFMVMAYAQDDATFAVLGANSVRARCAAAEVD